jgi:hypothetical protein
VGDARGIHREAQVDRILPPAAERVSGRLCAPQSRI